MHLLTASFIGLFVDGAGTCITFSGDLITPVTWRFPPLVVADKHSLKMLVPLL